MLNIAEFDIYIYLVQSYINSILLTVAVSIESIFYINNSIPVLN